MNLKKYSGSKILFLAIVRNVRKKINIVNIFVLLLAIVTSVIFGQNYGWVIRSNISEILRAHFIFDQLFMYVLIYKYLKFALHSIFII